MRFLSLRLSWCSLLGFSLLLGLLPTEAAAQSGSLRFTSNLFAAGEASGSARITFSRSGGTAGAVSVTFSAAAGSATAGTDFVQTTQTVSWASGDGADKERLVTLLDDGAVEGSETVVLGLTNPTGGAVLGSPSTAQLTILDDDGPGAGCTPNATTLCLQGARFRLTASWRTATGNQGVGMAVPLTGDTGYFWFFNPANVEMVVKVLNGCPSPFNSYWVFAGGLTNVEVDLTVVDTQTQASRTYRNPLRTPFQPLQDTSAFETCP